MIKMKKYSVVMIVLILLFTSTSMLFHPMKAFSEELSVENINITEYTNKYIKGYVKDPQKIEKLIGNVTTPKGTKIQFFAAFNSVTGEFKLDIGNQPNGSTVQMLIVYRNNGYQVVNEPSILLDKNEEKPPSIPYVKPLNEHSESITGYSEPKAVVKVWRDNQIYAEGIANQDGSFTIPIEKQEVGTTFSVAASKHNEISESTHFTVKEESTQKSIQIEVKPIFEQQKDISFKTEANTTIVIRKNYEIIYIIEPNEHSDEQFTVSNSNLGKDDEIFIHAFDDQGNSSEPIIQKVLDNKKPYLLPLRGINDATSELHVLSEPGIKIKIEYQGGSFIGEGNTDESGIFEYNFNPIPRISEYIQVTAIDKAGNYSQVLMVVRDVTPPDTPILDVPVYTNSTQVKGRAEKGTSILLKKNGLLYKTGIVYAGGTFQIDVSDLAVDDELEFTVKDNAGNISEPLIIKVTDPPITAVPIVNTVTNLSFQITGTADPNAVIELYKDEIKVKSVTANSVGSFVFDIDLQKQGTEFTLFAVKNGMTSQPVRLIVKDAKAPTILNIIEVGDNEEQVRGTVSVNSTDPVANIEVIANDKVIGTGIADKSGYFSVSIPMQKAGTTLKITSTDASGNSDIKLTIVKDLTPPEIFIKPETIYAKYITGKTEPNLFVRYFINGVLKEEVKSDSQGIFVLTRGYLNNNSLLLFQAIDSSGNINENRILVDDINPPEPPQVNTVTNKSTEISGKAEANATLRLMIGGKEYSAKADGYGNYKVTIPIQNAGTTISVEAKDSVGNVSSAKFIKVVKVAPNIPTVNTVNNKTNIVSGKTDAYATVVVALSGKIFSAKADQYGNYKVTIPIQNTGISISITAQDSSGKVSAARSTKVVRIAPNIPLANTVNNKTNTVTGKTEVNATVGVTISGKVYSAKADKYGNYKVGIPIQNSGISISITAKDSSGKISAARSIKVVRVAPNIPIVNTVKYYSTTVTGKTEKYAIVTVKIGTKTYTAKANVSGNYKVYIPKQRAGTKLNVNTKDSKGFVSATRVLTVLK
ncbi:Ig-like domain-containing protein [Gottfriedia sp. S16(2024)]|uniref:Ig-like domain-containing protein n=1 Tax=Gottfriedia sp. S16(2024) TaxID=3162883 RepID=UPI003D24A1EF